MRLAVLNLSPLPTVEDTEIDLVNLFSTFGQCDSAMVVLDKETGDSRFFAYVEMPNEDEARTAASELDGTNLHNYTIRVRVISDKSDGEVPENPYSSPSRPSRW